MRVLHAIGGGKYEGTAQSSFETPTSTGLQTFTTDLAIEAGELVTLENSSTSVEIGYFGVVGARLKELSPRYRKPEAVPSTCKHPVSLPSTQKFNRHLRSPRSILHPARPMAAHQSRSPAQAWREPVG